MVKLKNDYKIIGCISTYLILFLFYILSNKKKMSVDTLEYKIGRSWDGLTARDYVIELALSRATDRPDAVRIDISAPFFNDSPVPKLKPGVCPELWNYEVVELFFLGDNDHYLELEFAPRGHYLVLELHGVRNIVKDKLELEYTSTILNSHWTAVAYLPVSYLPPGVARFNAYAIHGHEANRTRTYDALYRASGVPEPDFHKLEFFKTENFAALL